MNITGSMNRRSVCGALPVILFTLIVVAGCEDEAVRGLDHGEFQVIPFESELSDLQSDVSRNVVYIADQTANEIHVIDAELDEAALYGAILDPGEEMKAALTANGFYGQMTASDYRALVGWLAGPQDSGE